MQLSFQGLGHCYGKIENGPEMSARTPSNICENTGLPIDVKNN